MFPQKAAPTRETNGGMRRCQRLPEVTHPVDSTRPEPQHIKSRARPFTAETMRKGSKARAVRPDWETRADLNAERFSECLPDPSQGLRAEGCGFET